MDFTRWPGDSTHWGLSSSFVAHLRANHCDLITDRFDGAVHAGLGEHHVVTPHATTILALRSADGVVMAGDRRATVGATIESRNIQKVFRADEHSAVAIAGAAGPAMEMVRLFQVELEHYEKIEGRRLSLAGKANRLAEMIRLNMPAAMQGLGVIPLFAGYDEGRSTGRIFKYDMTGGRYEEGDFHATGSGGRDARSFIKGRWREGLSHADAVAIALEALFEAADEDAATGGPDVLRGIYPNVAVVDATGFVTVADDTIAESFEHALDALRDRYGGAVR